MSLKNEAVQLQVMVGTQEGGLGDTHLQLQLRDSWRKPRGQKGDRLMVAYIQMTAVNKFPQLTILPRGGRGVLAGSTLVEIQELGILRVLVGLWLIWGYQIQHKSVPLPAVK